MKEQIIHVSQETRRLIEALLWVFDKDISKDVILDSMPDRLRIQNKDIVLYIIESR